MADEDYEGGSVGTGWGTREIRPGESYEEAQARWRREDIDAGRGSGEIYGTYGGSRRRDGSTMSREEQGYLSDAEEVMADVPILGWLGGFGARRDAARAAAAENRNRRTWEDLADYAPSADDLWVQYEEEGFVAGPEESALAQARADRGSIEAQQDALRALQGVYQSGGMTEGDRARQQLARMQTGQAMRASREADLQQLQARGMGGSGAALASMLGAQQMGAQSLAAADAQMLMDAQSRALQAMQAAGGLGTQMRGQSFDESATRGSALDDFNQWQTDYARGREDRNTDRRNQTNESRAQSRQQAYDIRERQAAGMTGQYSTDSQRRLAEGQRKDDSDAAATNLIGTVISAVAGG